MHIVIYHLMHGYVRSNHNISVQPQWEFVLFFEVCNAHYNAWYDTYRDVHQKYTFDTLISIIMHIKLMYYA
jgi:hypothetical protein